MNLLTYKKKPVEVSCVQYDGSETLANQIVEWVKSTGQEAWHNPKAEPWASEDGMKGHSGWEDHIIVVSFGENIIVNNGDWLVKGVDGVIYKILDEVFNFTYEPV